MKKLLTMAILLVIGSCCVVVNAQQQEPSLKPSLLLEVVSNPVLPPAYSTVNGPNEIGKAIAISNFVRVPGSSESSPPIRMVKVEPQLNGDNVAVRVTLYRGVKGIYQEELVGIYRLGIGETKTLKELRAFGIEPFTVTLLDTVPPLPPPPAFQNDTKAIEIVSVRSENRPSPAYIITLRNLSEKNVSALGLNMTFDGGRGATAVLGEEDRPLIPAGSMVEKYVRAMTPRRTATGFVPSAASSITIHIRSAVFTDLSYEGDVKDACFMESIVIGRRFYLTQALSLLDRQLSETFTDHIEAARQFKEKLEALRYDVVDGAKASSVSPVCKDVAQKASETAHLMKFDMLRDLDQIINTRATPPVNFRAWLETRRASYKASLARM